MGFPKKCQPLALTDSFLFRKWLRPSCPPIFFLPGACDEKKNSGAEDHSTQMLASLRRLRPRVPRSLQTERWWKCVLNTISQAPAPATRRLYAIKWSVFSTWCSDRGEDPSVCDISVILSFLQELLNNGRSPSTLKVYVAAIAASHSLIAGHSVGRDNLVVRFLRGARRLNPPHPFTVPMWALPTVLCALSGCSLWASGPCR